MDKVNNPSSCFSRLLAVGHTGGSEWSQPGRGHRKQWALNWTGQLSPSLEEEVTTQFPPAVTREFFKRNWKLEFLCELSKIYDACFWLEKLNIVLHRAKKTIVLTRPDLPVGCLNCRPASPEVLSPHPQAQASSQTCWVRNNWVEDWISYFENIP